MKNGNLQLVKLRKEVDKKLIKEGFWDNIKGQVSQVKSEKNIKMAQAIQQMKEKKRLSYVKQGLPVPDGHDKISLRQYYVDNNLPVPDFLQGNEADPTPDRTYTTGRKPADIEKRIKEKAADTIGDSLGLHPNQKKNLENALKVVSATGVASTAAAAYNWFKKTFGSKKAKEALPSIEKSAEDSAKPNDGTQDSTNQNDMSSIGSLSNIQSLSDISPVIAGIPANKEFFYIFIKDFEEYFDKAKPLMAGKSITEADAQSLIDNNVSDLVFGENKNKVSPGIKKYTWEKIYKNIKNDKLNDKTGMQYISGHYYIIKRTVGGRRQYALLPFGSLITSFPNLDISDLEY